MGLMSSLFGGSSGSSSSYVDPKQQPFLDFTRNTGQLITQQTIDPSRQFAAGQGQQLYDFGYGALQGLTGNPYLDALQQQAGGNQQLVGQQVGQLQADLGRAFNQQVLPGIRRDANAVGALGGGRQGVAEGIAAQGFADAFGRGVTDIYSQDAQRSLQAATAGGGLFAQSSLGALSSLPGLFETGLGQFTGQFAPLGIYSQILGAPTVLGQGSQKSQKGLLDYVSFGFGG